jgi:hypothetical protein
MSRAPTVIYLAGSGRSGSTLVERTLGEMPGLVNVGELIDLFRRVAVHDERCGCGERFSACPFWWKAGEQAFGGWDTGVIGRTRALQRQVARQRHLARLAAPGRPGREFTATLASYGLAYRRLYDAIAGQAGAQYVVDASKWPAQALALARAGLDIRVIHLVRDVRGVAYSLSKAGVARPHAAGQPDEMWHVGPASAAARWVACETEISLLRRCGLQVATVRYEDFVARPRPVIRSALAALRVPASDAALAHIGEHQVRLGSSHGLSGNPSRFTTGEIALRPDESWRSAMPRPDRAVVTLIGLPHLARYGSRRVAGGSQPQAQPIGGQPQAQPTGGQPQAQPTGGWPLVSVIVPTRGRPALVRETVRAIVAQDYGGELECIVVHDQEQPREDLALLSAPGRKVTVVSNTRAPGLAGARNTGVAAAPGDYLAGCDDDDVWHPGKLRLQMRRLLDDPGLLAVGSGIRLLLPGGKVQHWPARAELVSYRLLLRNRVKELHSSTMLARREAFIRAGLYDESLPGGYAEDYDWVLRVARAGAVGAVRQPLADVRKDTRSWYAGQAQATATGLESLLAKHPDIARSARGHARILGQIAFARSVLGDRRSAARYAARAVTRWPVSPHPYVAFVHILTGVDPRHVRRVARLLGRGMA